MVDKTPNELREEIEVDGANVKFALEKIELL